MTPHHCWCACGLKNRRAQLKKRVNRDFQPWQTPSRKAVQPPTARLKQGNRSFQKGTRCSFPLRHNSKKKDTNRPAQSSNACHTFLLTSISSHHIPLLHRHRPSTVRERLSCCDKEPLGSNRPATRPHAVPGTTYPGRCGSSRPPLQVPNLPRRVKSVHLTGLAP